MKASGAFSFYLATTSTYIYTLSLHDALPISIKSKFEEIESDPFHSRSSIAHRIYRAGGAVTPAITRIPDRSEEHTSELQSQSNIVCRLLLEKKNQLRGFFLQCHAMDNVRRAL